MKSPSLHHVVARHVVLACLLAGLASLAAAQVPYLGPDGEPLPLRDDAEVVEFLRTAKVVDRENIPIGVNRTRKLTLEKDGVRAHAAFRTAEVRKDRVRHGETMMLKFEDSYRFEVAAWEFSRLLGLDTIPPAVLRSVGGEPGSLQLWVEGAITERERRETGQPKPDDYFCQRQSMRIFDRVIYNFDRNQGNMLIDGGGKLWWIDHTRSFRFEGKLDNPAAVRHCETEIFDALQELDPAEVRERLKPYLNKQQIRMILRRRDLMVEYLEGLAVRHGADGADEVDELDEPGGI